MLVEPDLADVSGPIRFARPCASPRLRVALVVGWALVLLAVVELPLWLIRDGLGRELASVTHHFVLADGRTFIPRGHPVSDFASAWELRQFYAGLGGPSGLARIVGVVMLGLLSGASLQLLLARLERRLQRRREQLAIFAWLAGGLLLLRACLLWVPLAATFIPIAALLVPVALQLGARVAFGCALILCLCSALMIPPFDPVLGVTVAAQGMAVAHLTPRRRPGGWLWLVPFVLGSAAATVLGYLAAQLFIHGALNPLDLVSVEWGRLSWALIGGLCWPLVGLALDPVFERVVGNVSRSTLLELSDLNNPMLQRISTRAPGTWAHSRAMANLAESAAHSVGADALLIRVGAYYHDLGKADEPQNFIENLPRGSASPHDSLTPERSAEKIIHHVRSSVVRGRAAGLPEPIIDFMHTHHGDGRVEYFYQKARAQALAAGEDPKRVDERAFVYPGVSPHSPETGILLIVDSVEAASRTLARPDRKEIDKLLRQIVFSKLTAGQLDDCGLGLRELRRIIETLADTLLASAHGRITYPWQNEEASASSGTAAEPRAATDAAASAPSAELGAGLGPGPLRVIADPDESPRS
ncbi:HD domain protein [Enhygromyxa salina]|uniref:HD domain protein n=1 Tax=Enhygromyxa salina TaxID=215803 RepID=A0A2S9YKC7_9BACT|nr:HDIG domain-containing metalloprotein [Enhygromyxa salina]PRQ05547.1 HD domain protein [Enhygromyxa salina]